MTYFVELSATVPVCGHHRIMGEPPAADVPQAKAWVLVLNCNISVLPEQPLVPEVGSALNDGSAAVVPYSNESAAGTATAAGADVVLPTYSA
jgi:hypothetical protein